MSLPLFCRARTAHPLAQPVAPVQATLHSTPGMAAPAPGHHLNPARRYVRCAKTEWMACKPNLTLFFCEGGGLLVETETLQARAPAPWKRRWVGSPDQAWARCGNTSEKLTGPLHWSAPKVQAGVDALNTRPRKTPGCKQQCRP